MGSPVGALLRRRTGPWCTARLGRFQAKNVALLVSKLNEKRPCRAPASRRVPELKKELLRHRSSGLPVLRPCSEILFYHAYMHLLKNLERI